MPPLRDPLVDPHRPALDRPLQQTYDLAVVDLDGVVYIGPAAVPGAAAGIAGARAAGMRVAFATNSAARTPATVAAHLTELGISAAADDVVTSAQAGAALLRDRIPAGARVYVMGGEGLHDAVTELGYQVTTDPTAAPAAVIQGYGPEVPWHRIADGATLVADGLPWIATNPDQTMPTPLGVGPGTGMLVDLVARFSGRDPVIAGKPLAPLFARTQERTGGLRPLVIGDRIDTDIAGAHTMGWDSLLVMSGVTALTELVAIPAADRPTYVAADLRGLAGYADHGAWLTRIEDGVVQVTGSGDVHQWWRSVATAAWEYLDRTGRTVSCADLSPPFDTVAP